MSPTPRAALEPARGDRGRRRQRRRRRRGQGRAARAEGAREEAEAQTPGNDAGTTHDRPAGHRGPDSAVPPARAPVPPTTTTQPSTGGGGDRSTGGEDRRRRGPAAVSAAACAPPEHRLVAAAVLRRRTLDVGDPLAPLARVLAEVRVARGDPLPLDRERGVDEPLGLEPRVRRDSRRSRPVVPDPTRIWKKPTESASP